MNKESICKLIPHTEKMCLLDEVLSWDNEALIAESSSYLEHDNPLLSDGCLSTINGIEYAAQAMAVHTALINRENRSKETSQLQGYLASVRNIKLIGGGFEDNKILTQSSLKISVFSIAANNKSFTYDFFVEQVIKAKAKKCISGKITIIIQSLEII